MWSKLHDFSMTPKILSGRFRKNSGDRYCPLTFKVLALNFAICEIKCVNVISRGELFAAAEKHPETRQFIADFYRVAHSAQWRELIDVRKNYPSADRVGPVLIIDVLGNRFRLLFRANFIYKTLFFKGLYTHTGYGRLRLEDLCPH